MRAAVYHGAGDVRVEAVAAPGDPGPGQVLIAPSMAAICGTDASEYAHGPHMILLHRRHPGSGHLGPLVIGHEFVGRVEALGDGVDGLAVGDRVVSGAGVSCGECAWCRAGRTNLCASYYTIATVAHICDSNLPESLEVLVRTELAGDVLGEVIPMTNLVGAGIVPLAEGRANGKMVVEVAA